MALRSVTAEDITVRAARLGERVDARCTGTVQLRNGRTVPASSTHDCSDAREALTTYCEYWDLDAEDFAE